MQAKVSPKLLSLMSAWFLWRRRYSGYGGKTPAAFEKSQRSPIERALPSGTVTMQGHPLPDGGYITSFTDISMHKKPSKALKDANVGLEQRVQESSQELSLFNQKAFNRS